MLVGRPRPRLLFTALVLGLALVAPGCATTRPRVQAALKSPQAFSNRDAAPIQNYPVACPDVLEFRVAQYPGFPLRTALEPDGSVNLGDLGKVRIEGMMTPEIGQRLAAALGVPPARVEVVVADFQSRKVYLNGPVAGHQRAIAYQGPETVVDFLRRTGGLTTAAEVSDIHVIRPNVAMGRRPEVFPVNLEAILVENDPRTNVRLEPYDQVYIGENRRSCYTKYLPRWLLATGQAFVPPARRQTGPRPFVQLPSGRATPLAPPAGSS